MRRGQRIALSAALGVLLAGVGMARAADPEIDKLLQSPVGKDWVTNGGNMTNQRYSTLLKDFEQFIEGLDTHRKELAYHDRPRSRKPKAN